MIMTLEELETPTKLYTVAEFLELDLPETDEDGNPLEYELVEGEIMAKQVGPGGEHGEIVAAIGTYISNFAGITAGEKRVGKTYAGSACTLGNGSRVIPDLAFVLDSRLPDPFDGPIPVAPDLIVEVNSPTDTTDKIAKKIESYKKAGVRLVWSIYLSEKFIRVYDVTNPRVQTLEIDDVLEGGSVLPGFKLPVAQLFN